jgi:predicted dehydrogenase
MVLNVGVVGCGNISAAYLDLAGMFPSLHVAAVADLNPEAATARAAQYGIPALSPDALMADKAIDIVLNLTVPNAHAAVTLQALEAGKHVYSEKPVTTDLDDGRRLVDVADKHGLRFCCAPDTFLGGAHQFVRSLIDKEEIGRVISGTAHMMTRGVEHRHPNPFFFFQEGGGPVLDMGPYYLTLLINLLGPIQRVTALGTIGRAERTITFAASPFVGESIKVETETTVHAVLAFASGAHVSFTASWDVLDHGHRNIELYGTDGSLFVSDPNFFGGEVMASAALGAAAVAAQWDHPFGVTNWTRGDGKRLANYRGVGLADMADAILNDRAPRCDASVAVHVLDALQGILRAARTGTAIALTTTCERPAALDPAAARALIEA